MTAKQEEKETVVAIPGSVTDFAKGLRELIACLRDVAALVGDGGKFVAGGLRARRSRSAARNLDALMFSPSGSRQFLERIAEGSGTNEDVGGIEQMLAATADEVERSMRDLSGYRDALRETCGIHAAQKLDQIIYGKFGKDGLRRSLGRLVAIGRNQSPVPAEAVHIASEALHVVADLNAQITELHDLVLAKLKG
ncbi:hypothetical protein NKJ13_21065 [Mesorhizobium sp. M0174]|uniref:hypothetical protein n=1 Tax=Mesorhizobium sp. M0174 TaxID=2956904 RepID=UPI00333845CB